jgi:hypothetical protein
MFWFQCFGGTCCLHHCGEGGCADLGSAGCQLLGEENVTCVGRFLGCSAIRATERADEIGLPLR